MSTQPLAANPDNPAIDAENPWPGLSTFDEAAEPFFRGRDSESAELLRLVGQAPLTVLFGESGLGKSSLVQAGLFPRLRRQKLFPVYVRRLDVRDRSAPLIEQAATALQAEIGKRSVDAPSPRPGESLWEYLHGRDAVWWSRRNRSLTPIFVFDQFEEVFTLGAENPDGIERLRLDLADLIENRIPAALAERIESGASAEHLDLRGQRYKVLFSFREDFLPEVEGWKNELPSLMRNRLRLLPMNADQALQVVSGKTGAGTTHELVSDETAREVVRFVAAAQTGDERTGRDKRLHMAAERQWEKLEIEPALLSLLCAGLNEERQIRGQATIDAALLKDTGESIIGDFYQRCVADVPDRTRRFIEDALITEGGFRNSYPLHDALDQGALSETLLRQLVDRRLLRIDHQLGADRVELIHDRLTEVVRKHRDRERERIRVRRQRRRWWAAGGIAFVLGAFGVLFFLLWQDARDAEETTRATLAQVEKQKKRAEDEAERAEGEKKRANEQTRIAQEQRDRAKEATAKAIESLKEANEAKEKEARATVAARRSADAANAALREAVAGKLVMQSRAILEGQIPGTTDLALLLSAAGFRMMPDNEAYGGLQYALDATRSLVKVISFPSPVIAVSPDHRTLVTASEKDNTLRLWDATTGQPRGVPPLQGHMRRVRSVVFSPDGKTLVSGDEETWRLWDVATGRMQSVARLKEGVNSVAFSPDGKTLVFGDDTTLDLWDVATRQSRGVPLQGHTEKVNSVAFSPDGKTLVSGSYETLRLWDVATGQSRGVPLQGHTEKVNSVAFSPDGKTVVSGSSDKTLRLWDVATGQPRGAPLQGHTGSVSSVAFSPDGKTLVSGSDDETLRLWDVATGELRGAPLQGHTGGLSSVAFSPDGKTLISVGDDETLRLWDVATGQPRGAPLQGHTGGVGAAFSPDGKTLISVGYDETLRLWDVVTGELRSAPLQGHTDGVHSVAFSPDGKTLVFGSYETLRLWDVATGQPRGAHLQGHTEGGLRVAFSPDGKTLVSGSDDKTLRLWDVATGHPRGSPLPGGHTGGVDSVAFSPDGKTLVSGSDDRTLRLWDTGTGQPRGAPLQGYTGGVGAAFSPDGKTVVSGSDVKTLRLWDVATGLLRGAPLQGHTGGGHSLAFSPDGKTSAASEGTTTLRLWDVATGQPRSAFLQGHTLEVSRVAFSPDGKTVVSGSADKTLRLWDVATGQPRGAPLQGHTSGVSSVAFSLDGKTLVSSAHHDKMLRLWDVATGQPRGAPLQGHTDGVHGVAFSADGKTLVSSSYDKTLRLWDAPGVWIDLVCAKVVRNLSHAEWKAYAKGSPYVPQCPSLPVPSD
jgi:WD40 repeat protein